MISTSIPYLASTTGAPLPRAWSMAYEFWIAVDEGERPEGHTEIKHFEGGLYAVTDCRLSGEPNVMETWKMLWEWVQSSQHRWRQTHELEKPKNPTVPEHEIELELYLPIEQ